MIRELKEENDRLKARMGKGDVSDTELKEMAGKEGEVRDGRYNVT